MRQFWATASAALFVLSEIGSYLQGEVIQKSWEHFQSWLNNNQNKNSLQLSSRPQSQHDSAKTAPWKNSRPTTANSTAMDGTQKHDPETITVAHRDYLLSLIRSVLLTETSFTSSMRSFLSGLDHLIAFVSRLEVVLRNLDMEADEGVVDALNDYAREASLLNDDLRQANTSVQSGIRDIISRLRDIDDSRSVDQNHRQMFETTGSGEGLADHSIYVPRKAPGVDHLLMKLDSTGLSGHPDFDNDALEHEKDIIE